MADDELAAPLEEVEKRRLAVVSRGPLEKTEPFRQRMGWAVPWYSSLGSDFNYDFHVTLDPAVAPVEYNFRPPPEGGEYPMEAPGFSYFLRDGDRVFHTYSTYARGVDNLGFVSNFLDLTPLGRQEEWEEPKGRATAFGAPAGSAGVKYHDEY